MTGNTGVPVDAGEPFTGSWELLAAPATVVVLPPRSQPWGTAYCLSAATSRRRKGKLSREAPGERSTIFRDMSGSPVKTPSRPLPSLNSPREVVNKATKAWHAFFGKSGTCRDASSKFKGKKSHLRVSWPGCEPASAAPPLDVSGEVGGNLGVPPIPLDGVKAQSRSRLRSSAASGTGSPAASVKVRARNATNGRWASHLSLPDCWIADTGCGYDLLSKRWVDEVDQKRLAQIRDPPTFCWCRREHGCEYEVAD